MAVQFAETFQRGLDAVLKEATAAIVEEEIEAATQRVDKRIRELVATKAISVAAIAEVQYSHNTVSIRIIDPDNPSRSR